MFRTASTRMQLLGTLVLGLCGLGVGLGSKHFSHSSQPVPLELTQDPVDAGWSSVSIAAPPEPTRGEPASSKDAKSAGKRALLVGVTKYVNLAASVHLSGPSNDVQLLRATLIKRYDFPEENIVCLCEEAGKAELRPTRDNIGREFKRLADAAQAGDQIVVLLAGHGDRQPEADPPDPISPEPDGIDEIFLPADVAAWKGYPERVPNAIIDNEIRDWLGAITSKKAYVWAIFDCCHSGSMTRHGEVVRQLPAGVLVPPEELAKARERAAKRTGRPAPDQTTKRQSLAPAASNEYLVAMFACREHETTPECFQPPDSGAAKHYGLLTYSVVSALEQSAISATPLTYRELMQRIQLGYLARPQASPTPTVDGVGQARVVLGTEKPVRPRITLIRVKGEYLVNVGDLHGITPGSVLRVYSPAGEKTRPQVIGHVRVEQTRPLESIVTAVAHEGMAKPMELPTAGLCEIVSIDYSVSQLRVAIDPRSKGPDEVKQQVTNALKSFPKEDAGLFQLVDEVQTAHFLVRVSANGPELQVASGLRPPIPLPALDAEQFGEVLTRKLKAIHRAQSLISVGAHLEGERNRGLSGPEVKIEVIHRAKENPTQVLERPPTGWVFRPGDLVSFRIANTSKTKRLEVTLLVVDPDYQVQLFYPLKNEINKALEPGATFNTGVGTITDQPPFGPENMVAIITSPTNPPIDYGLLTQPGVRGAQDRAAALRSPIAQLLERSLNGSGTRSGLTVTELQDQGARVLGWRTEPTPKK